jgi:small subunit ribosomal protein S11
MKKKGKKLLRRMFEKNKQKQYPINKFFVKTTMNNTFVTITDVLGNVLVVYSAGKCGYKQAKRSSKYAAESVIQQSIKYLENIGKCNIILYYSGIRNFLKYTFYNLKKKNINILSVNNNTPIAFNGCRAPKMRRV